ncbi:hypothetical protein [Pontibacter pudoricolor]|uniref:hypothetical protein n=1 Tax=Pontibacter pudoricolor TaxID=2694930 RepID=UPI0013919BDA|nr:hypothetical protein [Pontibacter pudoricolor]
MKPAAMAFAYLFRHPFHDLLFYDSKQAGLLRAPFSVYLFRVLPNYSRLPEHC